MCLAPIPKCPVPNVSVATFQNVQFQMSQSTARRMPYCVAIVEELTLFTTLNTAYELSMAEVINNVRKRVTDLKIAMVLNSLCALFSSELTKDKIKLRKATISATSLFDAPKEPMIAKLPKCVQTRITDAIRMK